MMTEKPTVDAAVLDPLLQREPDPKVSLAAFEVPPPPSSLPLTYSERIKSTLRINVKLLPVKLLVFLIHGGIAALFPFFTLHMKSLGISIKEIAIILLLLPMVSSIGPPLGGALADRLGNYKLVLIIFSLLSILFHTLLWFAVPAFGFTYMSSPADLQNADFTVSLPCNGTTPSMELSEWKRHFHSCTLQSDLTYTEILNCSMQCPNANDILVSLTENDSGSQILFHWMDLVRFRAENFQPKGNTSWTVGRISVFGLKKPEISTYLQFSHCVEDNQKLTNNCSISCAGIGKDGGLNCNESVQVAYGDRMTTLALYFLFRFLSFTAIRVVFPLLDAAILEIAKEHKGDFGIQRLFASVGFCVMPPISGALIGLASKLRGFHDYSPAFYLFGGMNLLGTLLMVFMKITIRRPQTNIWKSVGVVMRNPNIVVFTIAVFFSGAAFGILVNFLFLFMENDRNAGFIFSAPKFLLGLTSTVGYLLGIPLLFFSSPLIALVGHENLVAIGLLCYAARFLSYSYTYNPFYILPIEIFTAVTGMIIVIAPQFAMKTSRKYLATLVALFGAVNFGLGGAFGPLVSGFLVAAVGYRMTFQICSAVCAAIGILYFLIYHLVLKRFKAAPMPENDDEIVRNIHDSDDSPKATGDTLHKRDLKAPDKIHVLLTDDSRALPESAV